jgi:hypothetical protein
MKAKSLRWGNSIKVLIILILFLFGGMLNVVQADIYGLVDEPPMRSVNGNFYDIESISVEVFLDGKWQILSGQTALGFLILRNYVVYDNTSPSGFDTTEKYRHWRNNTFTQNSSNSNNSANQNIFDTTPQYSYDDYLSQSQAETDSSGADSVTGNCGNKLSRDQRDALVKQLKQIKDTRWSKKRVRTHDEYAELKTWMLNANYSSRQYAINIPAWKDVINCWDSCIMATSDNVSVDQDEYKRYKECLKRCRESYYNSLKKCP